MDRAIYHVDGKGVAQHLEVILAQPEIQAIQWVQGLGKDWPILQWVPLLQRILAAGKSVLVDLQASELDPFMAAIKPEWTVPVRRRRGRPRTSRAATRAEVALSRLGQDAWDARVLTAALAPY